MESTGNCKVSWMSVQGYPLGKRSTRPFNLPGSAIGRFLTDVLARHWSFASWIWLHLCSQRAQATGEREVKRRDVGDEVQGVH